jgi:hypothetical protein
MLLLAVLLSAAAPTPAVAMPNAALPTTGPSRCPRTTSYQAWHQGKPLQPRRLTELPPANAYSAVYRHIGGCEAPIVVKFGVGNR